MRTSFVRSTSEREARQKYRRRGSILPNRKADGRHFCLGFLVLCSALYASWHKLYECKKNNIRRSDNFYSRVLILLFFGIFTTLPIVAAQNRFQMGIVGGLNFSELEGNSITDYYGINAGLLGNIKLTKNKQIGIELLYSQNGEYLLPVYPPASYGTIRLNHIEVPVHIDWLIKKEKTDTKYTGQLQLGAAYTKLLNHYIEDDMGTNLTDQVLFTDTDAIVLQGGFTYLFTDQVGLNLRATHSLNKALFWSLSARIVYLL